MAISTTSRMLTAAAAVTALCLAPVPALAEGEPTSSPAPAAIEYEGQGPEGMEPPPPPPPPLPQDDPAPETPRKGIGALVVGSVFTLGGIVATTVGAIMLSTNLRKIEQARDEVVGTQPGDIMSAADAEAVLDTGVDDATNAARRAAIGGAVAGGGVLLIAVGLPILIVGAVRHSKYRRFAREHQAVLLPVFSPGKNGQVGASFRLRF